MDDDRDNITPLRRVETRQARPSMLGKPCSRCGQPMHTVAMCINGAWYCQGCQPSFGAGS